MRGTTLNQTARASIVAVLAAAAPGCAGTDAVLNNEEYMTGGGGARSTIAGGGRGGCAGQCVPLGPAVWQGPTLLWMGNPGEAPECPPSAPVEDSPMFADLNALNVCGICKCDAPSGTCALPTQLTAYNSICSPAPAGSVPTSFDAPAGWDGSCTASSPIPANKKCNGVNCVQSLSIAPLTLTEAPCAVSVEPVAARLPSTWGTVARTCHGTAVGPCATPVEVCAPPAPPGFAQCLVQVGDRECPDAYPLKHVFYQGVEDTRACAPCACGAPTGSSCTAQLSVYKDNACSALSSTNGLSSTSATCFDVVPSGQALGSKLATAPVYAPGLCQASGGEPVGDAAPVEPSTFCCLPAGT